MNWFSHWRSIVASTTSCSVSVEPECDPQRRTQHSDLALAAGQAYGHAASAAEHEYPLVLSQHRPSCPVCSSDGRLSLRYLHWCGFHVVNVILETAKHYSICNSTLFTLCRKGWGRAPILSVIVHDVRECRALALERLNISSLLGFESGFFEHLAHEGRALLGRRLPSWKWHPPSRQPATITPSTPCSNAFMNVGGIELARARQPQHAHVRRVLQPHRPGQVGGRICAVMAAQSQYS